MLDRQLPTALLALALAASVASSQSDPLPDPPATGGSTQHVSLQPGLVGASGSTSSALHTAELAVAAPAGDYRAESLLHRIVGGVLAVDPTLAPTGPVVAGVTPNRVKAQGGASIVVHGLALSPGGLAPLVRFGGKPAAQVDVLGDGSVVVEVPSLVGEDLNTLALVDVEVETASGIDVLEDGLIATGAYLQTSPARIGSTFTITHYGEPNGVGLPFWGFTIPGGPFPLPPYGGALDVVQILYFAAVELLDPTGVSNSIWPVPDDPDLIGLELTFQSLLFENVPFPAAFTNVATVRIES